MYKKAVPEKSTILCMIWVPRASTQVLLKSTGVLSPMQIYGSQFFIQKQVQVPLGRSTGWTHPEVRPCTSPLVQNKNRKLGFWVDLLAKHQGGMLGLWSRETADSCHTCSRWVWILGELHPHSSLREVWGGFSLWLQSLLFSCVVLRLLILWG